MPNQKKITIAIDGFIPRTPFVELENDQNWRPVSEIEQVLLEVVRIRRNNQTASRRS